jgi:hypothetical protein
VKCMNRVAAAAGLAFLMLGAVACAGESEPGTSEPAETITAQPESAPASDAPASEAAPEPSEEAAEPTAEDVNGRWCVVDESNDDAFACVTIELPTATYDDGTTVDITAHDSPWDQGDGVFEFAEEAAPFGTYYPAGVPIEGFEDMGLGPDLVDEDRIWNSQDGFYAVRQ